MKLSIIIPVYNEENTIEKVLAAVLKVKIPWEKEIIVIDDGSTDGTRNRITNYELRITNKTIKTPQQCEEIKTIFHQHNQGKGRAVRSGIKATTGNYILIQDADLEYNPEEIPKLLSPILSHLKPYIAVYGSRFKNKNPKMPQLYLWGNKFLTFLTNILYGTSLTDMETGYKLLPVQFMKRSKLTCKGFDVEPEITAKLVKNKIPIVEIPISYSGRNHLAGKKLTIKDAFGAIKTLFAHRLRLSHNNFCL